MFIFTAFFSAEQCSSPLALSAFYSFDVPFRYEMIFSSERWIACPDVELCISITKEPMVKYVLRGFVAPDAVQKGKQNLLAVHKLLSPSLTRSLLNLQTAAVVGRYVLLCYLRRKCSAFIRKADSLASLNYTEVHSNYQKCVFITIFHHVHFYNKSFLKKWERVGFVFKNTI